jgi:hypothetical protein
MNQHAANTATMITSFQRSFTAQTLGNMAK